MHPTLVVLLAGFAAADPSAIEHTSVHCVVAGQFPRFEARTTAGTTLGRASVHFRPETAAPWYSVAMKPEGPALVAFLPRPLKTLKSFTYYIEVTDAAMATSRTADQTVTVVASAGVCGGRMVAATLGSASVAVSGPAGAAPVPAGFATSGVTTAAGSAAPVAGAAAGGGGGGIGAAALIIGGGAVAAGAVVAANAAGGTEEGGDECCRRAPTYGVSFAPFIDVSPCATSRLTWSSQVVSPDAAGNFDTTWAPNEPNTVRVRGQVTSTAFNATLSCVSGSGSGSVSATGSGGTYRGTFQFGASQGSVTVTAQDNP